MSERSCRIDHKRDPAWITDLLERLSTRDCRYRIHYGNTETGRDWMDEWEVEGYVRRSMGPSKVLLIVHNRRSMGGGAILIDRIVRIRHTTRGNGNLYLHPLYHTGFECVRNNPSNGTRLHWEAVVDGECYARFETEKGAKRWLRKHRFDLDMRDNFIANTLEGA